jgi:hypothetical protein
LPNTDTNTFKGLGFMSTIAGAVSLSELYAPMA